MRNKKIAIWFIQAAVAVLLASACTGPAGPAGSSGSAVNDTVINVTINGTSGSDIKTTISAAINAAKGSGGNDGSTADKAFTFKPQGPWVDLDNDLNMKALFGGIEDYYVHLDLSTAAGTTYPYYPLNARIDKTKILSLTLSDNVQTIPDGEYATGAFHGFTGLKTINAEKVKRVGDYTFQDCAALTTVNLPAADSIGNYAFRDCPALTTVTLGAVRPKVGRNCLYRIGSSSNVRTITVKRPASAAGAYGSDISGNVTTNSWANAFRGKGWDGTNYLNGNINTYITISFANL